MNFQNIMDGEDMDDHMEVADHWYGVSAQSTRDAYRLRLVSWILRIYTGAGGMPRLSKPGSTSLQPVAQVLQIPELADAGTSVATLVDLLDRASETVLGPLQTNGEPNWPVSDCAMSRTLDWLGSSAGLNPAEQSIFEFAVAMRAFKALRVAVQCWGNLTLPDIAYAVSAVLNIPLESAQAALHPESVLLTSAILRIHPEGEEYLSSLLFVSRRLAQSIAHHQGDPQEILSYMVVPLQKAELTLESFRHIDQHTELARSWLQGALHAAEDGETAGHLLVSGDPGLGKTEWARALLHASDVQALEMVATARWGAAISGEDRLQHLRMVLHMLRASKRGVILFDEADDVFRHPDAANALGIGVRNKRTRVWRMGPGDADSVSMDNHRAALNQLMETSRIPVIWIMNHPEVLDPAVLRRFDVEVHFDGIPRSVRLGLIQKRFGFLNECETTTAKTEAEFQRWADIKSLTPALIDRLARVTERAKAAGMPMDDALRRHWLRQRIPGRDTQHLQVTGADGIGVGQSGFTWNPYQVNANVDLMELVAGIQRVGGARLALRGEPGTGKTAFAKALARMLDKPLLEKRASDLLSAYVGETEQRICQAFEEAREEDAVLFIDEVDGLLANRDQSHRNWEVTQVNELLEQLGEYPGVVVIATNRMQAIDPAVQRRIDIQITFEALKPNQVRSGFAALCGAQEIACDETDLARVDYLRGVTPGDFAALSRRLRFAPDARTAAVVITLLQELLDHKQPAKQPMGFVNSKPSPNHPIQLSSINQHKGETT
jgi:SpoVK/Ycf46/Vps4 family AAA+-type ATPase